MCVQCAFTLKPCRVEGFVAHCDESLVMLISRTVYMALPCEHSYGLFKSNSFVSGKLKKKIAVADFGLKLNTVSISDDKGVLAGSSLITISDNVP